MPSESEPQPVSTPVADLDHPLVEVARRMLQPHPENGWHLDKTAVRIIEEAIHLKKEDPRLVAALLGLYEMAGQLHLEHGAIEAAGQLLAIIGRCAHELGLAKSVMDRIDRTHYAQQTKLREAVGGQERLDPSAPAPKGAIPTNQLSQVLSAHMGLRPSKPKKPKP